MGTECIYGGLGGAGVLRQSVYIREEWGRSVYMEDWEGLGVLRQSIYIYIYIRQPGIYREAGYLLEGLRCHHHLQ